MASEPIPISGLARRLVDEGILDADIAVSAIEEARNAALPLVSHLVQNQIVDCNESIRLVRQRRPHKYLELVFLHPVNIRAQ